MIAITGGGQINVATTATLRCTASTTEGNFVNAGLTAVKVGSIG